MITTSTPSSAPPTTSRKRTGSLRRCLRRRCLSRAVIGTPRAPVAALGRHRFSHTRRRRPARRGRCRHACNAPAMIAAMAPRAILLDALGTLVTFDADLVTPLARRHAIHVSREDAQRAMRAEMRHYRDHCIQARDRAALAQLRLDCAALIGRELGVDLPAAELVPTLLESIRFRVFPDAPGALARWRAG